VTTVELCVTVAAVTLSELSGVVPPTALVNVVVPVPPAIVSAEAPSSVLLKPMLALFEVSVLAPVKLTGLRKMRGLAPVTVILLAIWMVLALVKMRLVSALVLPTAAPKTAFPADPALIVSAFAPLIVLVTPEKVIAAPAGMVPRSVLSSVRVFPRVTGPVMVIVPKDVVIFPFKEIAVVPA